MKHLIIKNLGPIAEADIKLGELNVIIGAQGTGKSCVLKMACFCSWLEKRIMLTQGYEFIHGQQIMDDFVKYYKMNGYVKENTSVFYESPYLSFEFNNTSFSYKKKKVEQYKRPKITYVPTERNIVSVIPNFQKLPNFGNHIQDFMAEWNTARSKKKFSRNVLNLDLDYKYDEGANADYVTVKNSSTVELTNASSGFQSLLPMFVLLDFLTTDIYDTPEFNLENLGLEKEEEIRKLLNFLYKNNSGPTDKEKENVAVVGLNSHALFFWFHSKRDRLEFRKQVHGLLYTDHTEIFLEEPENSLFPPTQAALLEWLLGNTVRGSRKDTLFVATHSPYILTDLLEKEGKNVKLFFTFEKDGKMTVKTASAKDIQKINQYGVDMFFNFETFV